MHVELTTKDIIEGLGFELVEWDWEKREANDNDAGFDLVHKDTRKIVFSIRHYEEYRAWQIITERVEQLAVNFFLSNFESDPLIL